MNAKLTVLLFSLAFAVRACGTWYDFWHWDEYQIVLPSNRLIHGEPLSGSIYGPVTKVANVPAILLAQIVISISRLRDLPGSSDIVWHVRLTASRLWTSVLPATLTLPLAMLIARALKDNYTTAIYAALLLC